MRLIVSQKNIKKALVVVEKIVSKNISLPILNNVLIKTENGRLKLSATNLEIGINYFIGAKIEDPGEVAVPARIFSDFINNNTEEKIGFTVKNNTLVINQEKQKTQILAFDPKDFPIIPKIKTPPICAIQSRILKQGLLSVLDSVANSEIRPELSGVFMQFKKDSICFAATDSFRLAEKIINTKTNTDFKTILPRNTVSELVRILDDSDGEWQISFGDNQISFTSDDIEIISRVIDGSYPDYKKVIPDKWISRVLVSKNELEQKTRLAGLFSSNISDIKLSCDAKKIIILSKNSERGETQTSLDCTLKNEPFDLSINYHYLLDGLKVLPTENVVIEYTGSGSPLILRPDTNQKEMLYLIMPLRN